MGTLHRFRGDPANKDPFLEDFFRDMSPALARSFTDEQLREIKMQFGARDARAAAARRTGRTTRSPRSATSPLRSCCWC